MGILAKLAQILSLAGLKIKVKSGHDVKPLEAPKPQPTHPELP